MQGVTRKLIAVAAGGKAEIARALTLRLVDGLTLRAVEEQTRVSRSTLSRYERRVRLAEGSRAMSDESRGKKKAG